MNFNLTLIIIVLTGLTSYQAFQNPNLRSRLLFIPTVIKSDKEFYRFLSHGLIHADWTHLLLNMYVLFEFGSVVEYNFVDSFGELPGRMLFLSMYLLGIIAASIPSYFKHQDNYYYSALGASGAVSGVLLAYAFFSPWAWLLLFFIIPIPAIISSALYLWYSSYMSKNSNDNIGHDAHYYGAIFGLLFTVLATFILNKPKLYQFIDEFLQGPNFQELNFLY